MIKLQGELKLIGHVDIDSGQILITDPCYINSQWQDTNFDDTKNVRDVNTKEEYQYPQHFSSYEETLQQAAFKKTKLSKKRALITEINKPYFKKTINQLLNDGTLESVRIEETNEYSYDGCCKATICGENNAGQLNHKLGHEGAGVVSATRHGDGHYPVYALLDKDGCTKQIIIDFGYEEDEDYIDNQTE